MKRDRVKVGIIGLGKMGLLHASILSAMPDVDLVAICEKSNTMLKLGKKILREVNFVNDVDKLSRSDLDAVYVTTPIPTHFPICKTVYSNEIARNVFSEKTLASNYGESKLLRELSWKAGGVNMVGYMKRYTVTFIKAKELLEGKIIGDPVFFSAYAYSSDFFGVKKNVNAFASRGGVLWDLGAHVFDLALWYFGDLKVQAAELEPSATFDTMDSVRSTGQTNEGLKGQFDISWCRSEFRIPEFGMIIQGTRGIITVDDDVVKLELHDGTSQKWYRHNLDDNVPFLSGAPEFFREDEHYIKSILNSTRAEPDFETASKVDFILDQINDGRIAHE